MRAGAAGWRQAGPARAHTHRKYEFAIARLLWSVMQVLQAISMATRHFGDNETT